MANKRGPWEAVCCCGWSIDTTSMILAEEAGEKHLDESTPDKLGGDCPAVNIGYQLYPKVSN